VAVSVVVPPGLTVGLLGAIVRLVNTTGCATVTVTALVFVTVPTVPVAVIVAAPTATAVTTPALLTTAFDGSLET